MNARITAAIVASASLFALAGCASTTPTAAAPSPVVAFAVPAHAAAATTAPARYELTVVQMHALNASSNPRPFAGRK
jgi:predicted component of type VI protein secretion system